MNRPVLFLIFSATLIYGLATKSGTIDPIIKPSNNITALAEDVMVVRPLTTAKAYREVSQLLRSGEIVSSYQLGQELNARVTTIDKESSTALVAAMKPTLGGDADLAKDDSDGIKKWQEAAADVLEKAASGFERAVK